MSSPPATKPDRLDSIDCLRGLVMVLMALDHTRDFFGTFTWGGAENANFASPTIFFTRWVTHFCAPTFVLLAGTGAFLSQARGMSKPKLAAFLLSRGVWLVTLELTVVHFGWSFDWNLHQGMWQVIWAIGWSMVGLSLLIWLPAWLIGLVGCIIIGGHNYFDGLSGLQIVTETPWLAYVFGERGWFWDLLHNAYRVFSPAQGYQFFNLYPLLPWFGVLCAGYGLGPMMMLAKPARRKMLLFLGLLAIAGFVGLRYFNRYGDPVRWCIIPGGDQPIDVLRTTMSFLACSKYPPSLLYLLMTLGPALVLLLLLEWPCPIFKHFFLTYGRVPLFFYIVHLPVIHGLANVVAWLQDANSPSVGMSPLRKGYELPEVYLFWALIVLALYFPCLGYGWLKKRYGGLLKYL
jgi:uncharacterized membrane protein